jgi:hypothetical protein
MAWTKVKVKRGKRPLIKVAKWLKDNFGNPKDFLFCGGYMRWACSPHGNVNGTDIDIYVTNPQLEDHIKMVYLEKLPKYKLSETPTCYNFNTQGDFGYDVQIIKPTVIDNFVGTGSLKTIIDNFDFTICRIGISAKNVLAKKWMATADKDFMDDEKKKVIRIKNIHCPIGNMYRAIKYCKKGYWFSSREMIKLFLDWDQRDESYRIELLELIQLENPDENDIWQLERLLRFD